MDPLVHRSWWLIVLWGYALHLPIYSHQIVVLFQLLLTRSVVLSLRKYPSSFKESMRGFAFFYPRYERHIFFGLKFCLKIAIPPVISNDGLSVARMDTFWIFHFQLRAFQESKVGLSSLVLKVFVGKPSLWQIVSSWVLWYIKVILFSRENTKKGKKKL